jgi:hypothetical protein
MVAKHLDEARTEAENVLGTWLTIHTPSRAVLLDDLFGHLRVALWEASEASIVDLRKLLKDALGNWWTDEIWIAGKELEQDAFLDKAWGEAIPHSEHARFRILERHRNRGAWFSDSPKSIWEVSSAGKRDAPPILVFYSFKGGVGRTTSLASFALSRAVVGERVVVLDLDLEAPGVGVLLSADDSGRTSPWGLVDYLLETNTDKFALSDYYHSFRRTTVAMEGEIVVFPAGKIDGKYLGKLARIDFEPTEGTAFASLSKLLTDIREQLKPHWILLDARTGLSEPAGVLLSGLAHLHVLIGTSSEQTWQGLNVAIQRLGAARIEQELPQLDSLLVQALVPAESATARTSREHFQARAVQEYSQHYYAAQPDDPGDDQYWDLRDIDSDDAPHVPVSLSYDLKLSHFGDIADVAQLLVEGPEYKALHARISARFTEETE